MLCVLDAKSCVVVPAIAGFITALTIEGGDLIDVAFEPSQNTKRWAEHRMKALPVDSLHAVIAATARLGLFRLESDEVPLLLDRIKQSGAIAPELGVYAAYAFSDLQRRDAVRETDAYLLRELSLGFFDLGLLGETSTNVPRFPFVPMLSQGWTLLAAMGQATDWLTYLRGLLQPSLWTKFDAEAAKPLGDLIHSGKVR